MANLQEIELGAEIVSAAAKAACEGGGLNFASIMSDGGKAAGMDAGAMRSTLQANGLVSRMSDAASNGQAIEGLLGAPGRSEAWLIPALKAKTDQPHWIISALSSLRIPNEMKTAANYYAREAPNVARENIASGIERFAPLDMQDAWRDALAQLPKIAGS